MNITFNSEKNGIEIRFDSKPDQSVIDMLKQYGFRWSRKQCMWFAKQTDERKKLVSQFDENMDTNSFSTERNYSEKDNNGYNLWEMTRTESIGDNVDKTLCCKDIAAACRKHLRARFPMCKISVTSSHNSVSVTIVSSPFAKDSAELAAISKYCGQYVESFKYCVDYDPYGDYGSTYNFYGGKNYTVVDCTYVQTDKTNDYCAMHEEFVQSQAEYEKAEQERAQKEYESSLLRQAEAEAEAKKHQEKHDAEHETIVNAATVTDADYFILNMREAHGNKSGSLAEYEEQCATDDGWKYSKCHVTRELHFAKPIYDLFINHLLDDFDFIAGMGGDETTDYRIHSITDYRKMSNDEKSTVDWYCKNAIAVYCDDKMMFVIDAQGFSYARYVFLPCDESEVVDNYECKQFISKEQAEAYEDLSERIEDASAYIIISNDISNTWQTTSFPQYKKQLIQWIKKCNFPFDVNIARAVKDGCFKTALYRILNECDSLKEQFENAGLVVDQKVTMIRMSEIGSMSVSRMKFKGFTIGDYAQYKDSVRFVFRPENKRSDYYKWLYGDVLIYDGWMEVPEELLWETFSSPSGLACRKTRFLSCDKKQYDVIIDHFASIGKMPLINTYRPIFQSKHGGDMNDSGRSNQIRHGEAG